jgi:hypothetical protein
MVVKVRSHRISPRSEVGWCQNFPIEQGSGISGNSFTFTPCSPRHKLSANHFHTNYTAYLNVKFNGNGTQTSVSLPPPGSPCPCQYDNSLDSTPGNKPSSSLFSGGLSYCLLRIRQPRILSLLSCKPSSMPLLQLPRHQHDMDTTILRRSCPYLRELHQDRRSGQLSPLPSRRGFLHERRKRSSDSYCNNYNEYGSYSNSPHHSSCYNNRLECSSMHDNGQYLRVLH